jgi:beta-N-acetylhexosaminidase
LLHPEMAAGPRRAIVGVGGPVLTAAETALLRAMPPAGVILFKRNIETPGQLRALIDVLRRVLPAGAALMVDQEGGRVARLRPPYWLDHPPAAVLGRLFGTNPGRGLRAAWLTGALIGLDCAQAGFTLAAAPVLDLAMAGAHEVIGDRAFAEDAVAVARLARAMANGLLAAGVMPVGKHAPGHGRANVDSHLALPVVDAADLGRDLRPFALNRDLPWMMTAHIVYRALDPMYPATLSATVINEVIRGRIGFKGVLVTDDLAMEALSGSPAERARRALAAGCDLALYCSGDLDANEAVLTACGLMSDVVQGRMAKGASAAGQHRLRLDRAALMMERERLLA